jgi:hypothetical protein
MTTYYLHCVVLVHATLGNITHPLSFVHFARGPVKVPTRTLLGIRVRVRTRMRVRVAVRARY